MQTSEDLDVTKRFELYYDWAPVSESGFLRFSKNDSKNEIPGEFLKMVFKNGSAQDRRIIIGRLQQVRFPKLMEPKNRP